MRPCETIEKDQQNGILFGILFGPVGGHHLNAVKPNSFLHPMHPVNSKAEPVKVAEEDGAMAALMRLQPLERNLQIQGGFKWKKPSLMKFFGKRSTIQPAPPWSSQAMIHVSLLNAKESE